VEGLLKKIEKKFLLSHTSGIILFMGPIIRWHVSAASFAE
jgi:hypothetical protein